MAWKILSLGKLQMQNFTISVKLILKWLLAYISCQTLWISAFWKNTSSFCFLDDCINFTEKRRLFKPEQLIEGRIQPP